jgi:hypothetical protein
VEWVSGLEFAGRTVGMLHAVDRDHHVTACGRDAVGMTLGDLHQQWPQGFPESDRCPVCGQEVNRTDRVADRVLRP